MGSICRTAENDLGYQLTPNAALIAEMKPFRKTLFTKNCHSIAKSAVFAAKEAGSKAIIAFTETSDLPIIISKARASIPILGNQYLMSHYKRNSHLSQVEHLLWGLSYRIYGLADTKRRARKCWYHQGTAFHRSGLCPVSGRKRHCGTVAFARAGNCPHFHCRLQILMVGRIVMKQESVVFCAGNHNAFPGLSQTVKLSDFGHATAAENIKAKWTHLLGAIHLKNPKH